MAFFVRFDNKDDLEWLLSLLSKSIDKMKGGLSPTSSLHGLEDVILRTHETLSNYVAEKDLSLLGIDVVKVPKAKKDEYVPNLCPDHPHLTMKRVPSTDCDGCWSAYKRLHPDVYDQKRNAFVRKQQALQ